MPFPNEHSARLISPNIDHIRVRRTSGSGDGNVQGKDVPTTIDIIWFIIQPEDNGKPFPRAQALRFPIKTWTEAQARKWLKDNEIKFILFEKAIESDSLKFSFDIGELGKSEITQEGFLRAPIKMSMVGVMDYGYAKKVKKPAELFSVDTINSFQGLPIVDEHPKVDDNFVYIDVDNYKQYAKGSISEPQPDGKFLKGIATIWDRDLIKQVQSGEKREASIAYSRKDDYTPGEFDGDHYDAEQKNIIGNHLALTTAGRAGEMVKIEIDSKNIKYNSGKNTMPKIKYVKIDADDNNKIISDQTFTYHTTEGNDIQVDSDIQKEFRILKKAGNDSLETAKDLEKENEKLKKDKPSLEADNAEIKKLTVDLDAEKAVSKKLQTHIDSQKSEFDSAVDKSVNERIDLIKNAKALKIETDKKSNIEIKRQIIAGNLDVDDSTLKTDLEVDAYYKAALKVVRDKSNDGDKEIDYEADSDLWKKRQIEIDKLNNSENK